MAEGSAWRSAWSGRLFRIHLLLTLGVLASLVVFLPYYFHEIIGPKAGMRLQDPFLAWLPSQDCSIFIFTLIYLSVLSVIAWNRNQPQQLLLGLQCYTLLTLLRVFTMYVFTLDPPDGIVPLADPIVDKIAYQGSFFSKDLFFSGHTSTLFMLFLIEAGNKRKYFLLASTLLVAFMLLVQHVHYTVDVLAAPLAAYGCYWVARRLPLTAR